MVLGPRVKIIILNILSESKRLELKFSLKIAFMFLAEDLTWQIGDRVRVWRVITLKIQCTNFFQFEFRNKSFCVQLLSNCSSFSSLNFETSLFAYNYFLIATLIVDEVYLGITC